MLIGFLLALSPPPRRLLYCHASSLSRQFYAGLFIFLTHLHVLSVLITVIGFRMSPSQKNERRDSSTGNRASRSKTAEAKAIADLNIQAELKNFFGNSENCSEIQAPLLEEIRQLKELLTEKDAKISRLETACQDLYHRCDFLQQTCTDLEEKCDALEQYSRRNSMRLSGVPEGANENCLSKTLTTLDHQLGLSANRSRH